MSYKNEHLFFQFFILFKFFQTGFHNHHRPLPSNAKRFLHFISPSIITTTKYHHIARYHHIVITIASHLSLFSTRTTTSRQIIKSPLYAYKSVQESAKIRYQLRRVDCYNGETIKHESVARTEVMVIDVFKGRPSSATVTLWSAVVIVAALVAGVVP